MTLQEVQMITRSLATNMSGLDDAASDCCFSLCYVGLIPTAGAATDSGVFYDPGGGHIDM